MSSKNLKGIVYLKNSDKTVIVKITKKIKHKKYKKFIKNTTKFFVHDEKNECKKNDLIIFKQTSPISKIKHCILISKIKEGKK